ncbi:MAG: alpha/beta fold hydrolase [Candidatus Krumholzibacteriia bacterium]
MTTQDVKFPGLQGDALAARLDRPDGPVRGTVLFAHCFTCGKDLPAIARVSRALTGRGLAVLRVDFTGIGDSEGDFAGTSFSTNVGDLLAAAEFLRRREQSPVLMVGHSLGGAAVLVAAARVPECRTVATLAAPSEPASLVRLLVGSEEELEREGSVEIAIGGRPFRVGKQFFDDIRRQNLIERLPELGKPLLIMHGPEDRVVPVASAHALFEAARHPKSLVALPGADHLLKRQEDAQYAADLIATWADRYL